jgi:hypothetical protein
MRNHAGLALSAMLAAWLGGWAEAHPGAIADGRAMCGKEYSTAQSAYRIPDIEEAWYLRRIATCEQPVFWTTFDIVEQGQQLYIATITPKLERFKDKLTFNAILYGPGVSVRLPGLSAVPKQLPAGVALAESLGGAAYLKSPSDLSSCAFVDTNEVMKSYSDEIEGRCMEELWLDNDYKDGLQAGTWGYSWWLYSFNHAAALPGKYYLQSWLTDTSTGAVAQGKYEMTLGPWTWGRYANESTMSAAQEQGTNCACAVNALHYKESQLERLGQLNPALFLKELPGGSCAASPPPASTCVTQVKQAPLSADSSVEWSGVYDLKGGRTYKWTWNAHGYQHGNTYHDVYPDPGIDLFVTQLRSAADAHIKDAATAADAALKAVDPKTIKNVTQGETLSIHPAGASGASAEHILFSNPAKAKNTTVMLKPSADGLVAVFTQVLCPRPAATAAVRDPPSRHGREKEMLILKKKIRNLLTSAHGG